LITNDWRHVRYFKKKNRRIVYKSISSVRSIVTELVGVPHDNPPMAVPVQFQEYVSGTDMRIHVVGSKLFATAILHDGVDYRELAAKPKLVACNCPQSIAKACIALSRVLQLPFVGIDLRIATNGLVYCFEANPSPGYSFYEQHAGQPISAAVADYLLGAE
jgi:glutathione synthase/RimK-type ligase-like ATP-grasp enzyme